MSDDVHEVYAIRYGHHDRKAAENYIFGDPHDVLDPLDFYVWAIALSSSPRSATGSRRSASIRPRSRP
jgi:hypothetical protein